MLGGGGSGFWTGAESARMCEKVSKERPKEVFLDLPQLQDDWGAGAPQPQLACGGGGFNWND
jgi:hypothetical protein